LNGARHVRRVRRLDLFDLLVGEHLGRIELAAALQLARAFLQRRVGHSEIGAGLRAVELDEDVTLADLLALGEPNRRDEVGNLGGHVDGFAGTRVTERFDFQ